LGVSGIGSAYGGFLAKLKEGKYEKEIRSVWKLKFC